MLSITSKSLKKLEKKPRYMEKPNIVNVYDINHAHFKEAQSLRYVFTEPLTNEYPLNLNGEYKPLIKYEPETQLGLLKPLLYNYFGDRNKENISKGNENDKLINVFTRRGILEQIMEFPYRRNDINVLISRYNGQIFIIQQQLTEKMFNINQGNSHYTRLCELLLKDVSEDPTTWNDENIFQVAVYEATIEKFKLHYIGRAHAIKETEGTKNYLKDLCMGSMVSIKQMWINIKDKEEKYLKYWLQAYLSNVQQIYLAIKDTNAMVTSPIQCLHTCEIPKMCTSWKPNICTTFLNNFLEHVERVMSRVNSLDTVFQVRFDAKNKTVHYVRFEGKTDKTFIAKEFSELNIEAP
uniref:Decapping nuclease n=1 Tax=Musca domestica TaxID=7370 RepID=A0A1I8NKF8_MUSDO